MRHIALMSYKYGQEVKLCCTHVPGPCSDSPRTGTALKRTGERVMSSRTKWARGKRNQPHTHKLRVTWVYTHLRINKRGRKRERATQFEIIETKKVSFPEKVLNRISKLWDAADEPWCTFLFHYWRMFAGLVHDCSRCVRIYTHVPVAQTLCVGGGCSLLRQVSQGNR